MQRPPLRRTMVGVQPFSENLQTNDHLGFQTARNVYFAPRKQRLDHVPPMISYPLTTHCRKTVGLFTIAVLLCHEMAHILAFRKSKVGSWHRPKSHIQRWIKYFTSKVLRKHRNFVCNLINKCEIVKTSFSIIMIQMNMIYQLLQREEIN